MNHSSIFGVGSFLNQMRQKKVRVGSLTLLFLWTSHVAAQLPTSSAGTTSSKVVKLSGEVAKGQRFEKEIGNQLFFRLDPFELGWTISIGTTTSKDIESSTNDLGGERYNNFAHVVTPPYRFTNPTDIEGWHFRNLANTGPNLGEVNAPQVIRQFEFVLSDADYLIAFDALQIMLWPGSQQRFDDAAAIWNQVSKGQGRLTIHDLKLNNLVIDERAGIDLMKFEVELSFP